MRASGRVQSEGLIDTKDQVHVHTCLQAKQDEQGGRRHETKPPPSQRRSCKLPSDDQHAPILPRHDAKARSCAFYDALFTASSRQSCAPPLSPATLQLDSTRASHHSSCYPNLGFRPLAAPLLHADLAPWDRSRKGHYNSTSISTRGTGHSRLRNYKIFCLLLRKLRRPRRRNAAVAVMQHQTVSLFQSPPVPPVPPKTQNHDTSQWTRPVTLGGRGFTAAQFGPTRLHVGGSVCAPS